MQVRRERGQEELFVAGTLGDLVPEDHMLKRVDRILDLSWLHASVSDVYSPSMGRPSIDPESALRLMLAGFFEGIVHDRKLMRRAQTDLAFRWFAGYRLDEALPHHSSLTRIRQRWGAQRFEEIFQRTVRACLDAGLLSGDTVHIDATLIRADVSWDSMTTAHIAKLDSENASPEAPVQEAASPAPPARRRPAASNKRSKTDPDATLTAKRKGLRAEPSYKQHTATDDKSGVVVDAFVTTGACNEGRQLGQQLERIQKNTGLPIKTVTADAGYAHAWNYAHLAGQGIDAVIPPQPASIKAGCIPLSRFKYDPHHQRVRCPKGKFLKRIGYHPGQAGWRYAARTQDCATCPLRDPCLSAKARKKMLVIVEGYEALTAARRRKARGWDPPARKLYGQHRWQVEGIHGEAKTQHGLRRAARRGLQNVAIQAYLTAAVINLKRLAKANCPADALRQALSTTLHHVLRILPHPYQLRELPA